MPIHFTCPHCGTTTNVADAYAGQSGPCSHCGRIITIPHLGGGAAGYAPPARSSAGPTLIVVLAVVCVVVVGCGGILLALLLPAVQAAREAARRAQCSNNLKQISLALLNYESVHGCFPPAYFADKDGRPMHSWRVMILPYLEQQGLYQQYRFDEPWDGPNNRALAARMPSVFRCPSDSGASATETDYAVIVSPGDGRGPKTVFDGATSANMSHITDGTSNTIMVVEAAGARINWMEPRDLDLAAIRFVNDPSQGGGGISSKHPGGANVGFCDGSVHFLSNSLDGQVLQYLVLRDDRHNVNFDRF